MLNVDFAFGTIARGLNDVLLNIKELRRLGHEVSMVTSDAGPVFTDMKKETKNNKFPIFQESKPIEIVGIPTYVLHCAIPKMGWYCPGANKLAREIVKNYDVIHIRNWYDHLSFVFSRAAYEYGIPYVFTAHGTLHSEARKRYMRRTKWVVDHIYTKKMIIRAAALHSTGESETSEFIKMGADPQKIFRINPSIILDNFEIKTRTNILERLGVDKNSKPYILFLSRVDKKKGIELLLESFARLNSKNLTLVIAGSGSKQYEQKIRQMVHVLGLENSVKFAGFVLGDEKWQLLESAKIFALTSYSDVHPIAITDALTMGIPVLVTKNCDFPEVEEYEAGVVVDADIESIHQGLVKILSDENRLVFFSKNAKRLVSEKFLYEGKVKKYEEMYKYAIENKQQS